MFMSNKIKIRTMKDDLADANNANNISVINNENKKPVEKKQDLNRLNKSDIAAAKTDNSNTVSTATPNKLKDEEISELKNLIGRISEDSEDSDEKKLEEENVEKKDTVNIADKKELKDLISKISETIDKKKDEAIQTENVAVGLNEEKKKEGTDIKKVKEELRKENEQKEVETEIKKIAENKQSFWSDISKKLKDNESTEPQKINAIKEKERLITKNIEDIKNIKKKDEEDKKEDYSNSGILTKKEPLETKEKTEEKKEIKKNSYNSANYQPPENRLIFGKQKKYSSVSKRIKLKDKKDEIEDLKNADEIKEKQKVISEKEKYLKLKSRVIKKYNVKLFLLPWKKIIPTAIILIILTGVVSYFIFSNIKQPVSAPPAPIVGNELKEFSDVKKEIIIAKKDLEKFNNLETDALKIFNSDRNIEVIKLLVVDNEIDKNILPLQETLDAIDIINLEEKINYLPENFLGVATNNYSLLLFKTKQNTTRYGLAIETNNKHSMSEIMKQWEEEKSINKKMTTVLKPLFRSDRSFEEIDNPLSIVIYKNIEIRYLNLVNEDTALDYFIYKNILVIATSKDSAFIIADLLTSNE